MYRLLVLLPLLITACEDDPYPVGHSCEGDRECASGLVCGFGICRDTCSFDADCGGGRACVRSTESPGERICTDLSEACNDDATVCFDGTECAYDGICREPCDDPTECGAGRICALGACVDEALMPVACDDDGDGYLDAGICHGDDCDDDEPLVNPGAPERCETDVSDDCDAETNEDDAEGCTEYLADVDGDGFGVDDDARCLCAPIPPHVASVGGDCDDAAAESFPGAVELCDGADNDCAGDGDPDWGLAAPPTALLPTAVHDVRGPSVAWGGSGFAAAWVEHAADGAGLWGIAAGGFDETGLPLGGAIRPEGSLRELAEPRIVWAGDVWVVAYLDLADEAVIVMRVELDATGSDHSVIAAIPAVAPTGLSIDYDGRNVGIAWSDQGPLCPRRCVAVTEIATDATEVPTPVVVRGAATTPIQMAWQPAVARTSSESLWAVAWRDGDVGADEPALRFAHVDVITGTLASEHEISTDPDAAHPAVRRAGDGWVVVWAEGAAGATAVHHVSVDVVSGMSEVTDVTPTSADVQGGAPALVTVPPPQAVAWLGTPSGRATGLYLSLDPTEGADWPFFFVGASPVADSSPSLVSGAGAYALTWRAQEGDETTPLEQAHFARVVECGE